MALCIAHLALAQRGGKGSDGRIDIFLNACGKQGVGECRLEREQGLR